MNVGIIGDGYIGKKRAGVILDSKKDKIISVFDIDPKMSLALAESTGASIAHSAQEIFKNKKIDTVIIATFHNASAKLCLEAIKNKKNILCEKPLGVSYKEAKKVFEAAKKNKVLLKAGFNHRFLPAVMKAHELAKKGEIGRLMYMRIVYGHGGRKGYDLEWRMKKKFSGGGQLLDQGVHTLDLSRWFLGEFKEGFAYCENMFWKKSNLEDNAFCTMRTGTGKVAQIHVSTTQWRNKFAIELFGDKGYITVSGKGGAYGQQKLVLGKRISLGAPPEEQEFVYDRDTSWEEEWKNFRDAVNKKTKLIGDCYDGMMANKLAINLYLSSKRRQMVFF